MSNDEMKSYVNYALDNIDWFYGELNKGNLGKNWETTKIKLDDTRQLLLTILSLIDSQHITDDINKWFNNRIKQHKQQQGDEDWTGGKSMFNSGVVYILEEGRDVLKGRDKNE